jgi:TolB-like protein
VVQVVGSIIQIIGYKETPVAEVEVIGAREKTAIAKVVKKSEDIKEGDRAYELRKKITRIAVTEFPFRDKFNALTRNVQDILYTTLIQKGITVIEREKLEDVLREQKTGTTGVIDLSTAAQMGKLLGVEAVVVGSIADLGNSLAMIGRLVDVEKGAALSAGRIELAKTPMLADLTKTDVRTTRLGAAEARVETRPNEEPAAADGVDQTQKISLEGKQTIFEDREVFFRLLDCEILEDRRLRCNFLYKYHTPLGHQEA